MDKKVEKFLGRLEYLYSKIENFSNKYKLSYRYEDIELHEEYAGKYICKEMYVLKDGEFLFKLKPIGAYIIGADARVDIIGSLDKKVLVYLEKLYKMEFSISTTTGEKEVISTKSNPLYEGFQSAGWYITTEGKRILPLTDENICGVLEEISEFSSWTKSK